MKNKKTILAAVVASVVASATSHAKLSGAYLGISGATAFDDSLINTKFGGTSAIGNMSTISQGFSIECGYNEKFDNFLLGAGLSYAYVAPSFKHVAKDNKATIGGYSVAGVSGHRINLDINAGYSFEDKVALSVGGIISYNPGKPKYLLSGFDKKAMSDFGFGFKVGTNFKLTECLSWDFSYRMTWFSTTKDYKDLVKKNGNDDMIKVSEFRRVDKMFTTGIRLNF